MLRGQIQTFQPDTPALEFIGREIFDVLQQSAFRIGRSIARDHGHPAGGQQQTSTNSHNPAGRT